MNLKKLSLIASLLATTSMANAAEELVFNVTASVPENSFYVLSEGGWASNEQRMTWSESSIALNDLNRNLLMKNSAGGIKAYLADAATLATGTSADNIPLKITIAGKDIPTGAAGAVEILNSTDAATEKKVGMIIAQRDTYTEANRPGAGQYDGTITMMFESDPVVTP
ncbi:TPA: fimbrial assembly protein [Enterobacter bugandensis]|nr:fimbrial assembly protein [Enterobacter bugandensis]